MTHELKKRLDALRAVAPRLDSITDDANRIVAHVEQILVDELHLGVTGGVTIGSTDLGADEDGVALMSYEFFGFKRIAGRFRIAITTMVREANGQREIRSTEDVVWPSCTREQKLRALADLPSLLDEILKRSETLATKAERAAAAIKDMVGDLPPEPIVKPKKPFNVDPSAAISRAPVFRKD